MHDAARAVVAEEVVAQIETHIADYLKGGPDREAEDTELGRQFGLKAEVITDSWNKARTKRAAVETEAAPLIGGKVNEQKFADDKFVMAQPKAEAFFKKSEIQPVVEMPAQPVALVPVTKSGVIVDMGAPYEVARHFLIERCSKDGVVTLRWWRGEWRKWTGTHYVPMEEDALRAELYQFLAKANGGKFDPAPRHVNAVVDAIKAWALLGNEVEIGAWLGDGKPAWGDEAIVCCKNGVLRLRDGKLWPHDPKLFALNVIEAEYRPGAQAPRWAQFLDELWPDDRESRETLQEIFGLAGC